MATTARGQEFSRSDADRADLFFRTLFRLGVWVGDWETWYGTRPLEVLAAREAGTTSAAAHRNPADHRQSG